MKAILDARPETRTVRVYMRDRNVAWFYKDGKSSIVEIKAGDEMPAWMVMSEEEYEALADAIMVKHSPRYAESALLTEVICDTRMVRDRLLAIVEERK